MASRGRPKSDSTLEREMAEAWLKIRPSYIPPISAGKKQVAKKFIENLEQSKRQILRRYCRTSPHDLRYAMECIDESFTKRKRMGVLKEYAQCLEEMRGHQSSGGQHWADIADKLAFIVWSQNSDLVGRIKNKSLTIHGAARIIFEQWKRDARRPKSKTRGVNQEDPPSIKTLSRWFKRYIEIVGQGT